MRQIYVVLLALCASVAWADDVVSGKFTVNEKGDQVYFAPGNLQYNPGTGIWSLAGSQTSIIGYNEAYATEHTEYSGPIDLFPWGEDYGAHIGEGWRLLTDEEWQFLLREEEVGYGAENAGQATIGTQHGLMLVPDGWNPFATLTITPSPNNWTKNRYSEENWVELEKSGAVFLPCAENMGQYWSATPKGESNAYCMYFAETTIAANTPAARTATLSVRLVKDVKKTPTGVENGEWKMENGKWTKVIRDGQLFLIHDNKTYTILGQEK